MKITEIIETMKKYAGNSYGGKLIEEGKTRDKILYGNPDQECTGVICTCYASVDVIKQAGKMGYNFIVVHEALFWNHGDHTDWLQDNTAFQKKKALLDQYGICVWRNHDHIHAGIPVDGQPRDGIFYGMSTLLGWNSYMVDPSSVAPRDFLLPEMTVKEMAEHLIRSFHLKGVRFIGNPDCKIRRVHVPMHICGHDEDRDLISKINEEDINCLLSLEMVDFTACEYMRDAAMEGEDRCIFALGHFNLEELGMEYYAGYLAEKLGDGIPVRFLQSGDSYSYIPAN